MGYGRINIHEATKRLCSEGKERDNLQAKEVTYGMKKSPRMWYQKFDTYILKIGFVINRVIHNMWIN
jgi:hypothetical protein